jgi:hypothetical protein
VGAAVSPPRRWWDGLLACRFSEIVAVESAGVAGRGGEDEPGGCFGGEGQQVGQHAGVGVGGQDAAVPELGLHCLQVHPGANARLAAPCRRSCSRTVADPPEGAGAGAGGSGSPDATPRPRRYSDVPRRRTAQRTTSTPAPPWGRQIRISYGSCSGCWSAGGPPLVGGFGGGDLLEALGHIPSPGAA